MRRSVAFVGIAAAVAAVGAGPLANSTTHTDCTARTGPGAYDTTLSRSSGPAGSTLTVSGPLPVTAEDGSYAGQTATDVDVYWNLDFDKWWSVLGYSPSPAGAVAGSPVQHLGTQDVSQLCRYQVPVVIPSVGPGVYPIEVLYGDSEGHASFAPVSFEVTAG